MDIASILELHLRKRYSAIESFCGAGGMSLGLLRAGFDIKLAFDLNKYAVDTYNCGISPHAIQADASMLTVEEIILHTGIRVGELDLFSGGPPCQGFSKQRKGAHLWDDPRNSLVGDYIRFVSGLKPKAFMLENVAIFGQKRGASHLEDLRNTLKDYNLYPNFYNSADFGLAQTRERFILVGIRKDIETPFEAPHPTHTKWPTVGEVIGDLPEPPDDYSIHEHYFNHQKAKITALNEKRFSFVPQGGGWQDIPYELRLPCHQKADVTSGGWPDVYGRLTMDGQCPTITGGFDSFTRGRYGHPLYNRALTPREAARLQGFPDSVEFKGNRQEVRYQIGNAVPPPVAEAIGKKIISCFEQKQDISPRQISLAI